MYTATGQEVEGLSLNIPAGNHNVITKEPKETNNRVLWWLYCLIVNVSFLLLYIICDSISKEETNKFITLKH